MEIYDIFIDTTNMVLGEVIGKDNNKFVAKYYGFSWNCSPIITYGIVKHDVIDIIIGKKHIVEYLEEQIKSTQKILNTTLPSKEKLFCNISNKVSEKIEKNVNLLNELQNIQKKQEVKFTSNRMKQTYCIMKAIRRNIKYLKGLEFSIMKVPFDEKEVNNNLKKLTKMLDFAKKM